MPVIKDIPPIKRKKLSDEVTQALEQIIIENKLQAGDMLPSQAELSQKLHVGTRSIREAVRSLESRGMVETRQGRASSSSTAIWNISWRPSWDRSCSSSPP